MFMRVEWKTLLIAGVLFSQTLAHAADKSAELRARLKDASELSALDAAGLRAWHWKTNLTTFDVDGKNPKTGTMEIWYEGSNELTQYAIGDETGTLLRVGDTLYCTPEVHKELATVSLLQLQLLHPIPDEAFLPTTTQRLTQEKNGGTSLDLIAPTFVPTRSETIEIGTPFTFVLEGGTPQLLMTLEKGDMRIVRFRIGTFQNHEAPTDLQIYLGKTLFREAITSKLETFSPQQDFFGVKPEMVPFTEPASASPGDMSRFLLSQTPPVYPQEAKMRHVSGSLLFDVVIGKDGHIKSVVPTDHFDASLLASAKKSISSSLYRPFVLNGVQVEVKTQIRIIFNFG
jgi:hypothetical protein